MALALAVMSPRLDGWVISGKVELGDVLEGAFTSANEGRRSQHRRAFIDERSGGAARVSIRSI